MQEECLKTILRYGGTTYQNICDGTVAFVPWGGLDWVVNIFINIALAAMTLAIGVVLHRMIKDR